MEENEERLNLEPEASPNDFPYRLYSKINGALIGASMTPADKDDPEVASTSVPLPDGELNYAFDESINLWRGYTNEEWFNRLNEAALSIPDNNDEWRASIMTQMAVLNKQLVQLGLQNAKLTARVTELEKALNNTKESETN
ncbi:hypothetical protein [Weissella minor]|uniref:Uncharacterized protein n=1 Tax=Weissella minor TaxID=1620 RepID=A0A0R2JJX2_9LACO|nr:hypothetical protein [Weissella minor]KRN77505.1 hypothetical protein IV67_GL001562 [Weissella minor]